MPKRSGECPTSRRCACVEKALWVQNALPIDSLKDEFNRRFLSLGKSGRLVLTAPTGSGKSTRVPLWCQQVDSQKVLVVEPRRVACRTLAQWVAKGLGEKPGARVGFRVRFESRATDETEILFVTPGIARRMLVEGEIENYATVIFDEFHERSWETDSLLAFLAARSSVEQRLIIMSATLMAEELATHYGAEMLRAEGRAYPVSVSYWEGADSELTVPSQRNLVERVIKACNKAWQEEKSGKILVFLPGLSAMKECASRLGGLPTILLHGTFSQKEQAKAFQQEERQVILATNVAESSLTIPGVTTVIDSGLERRQIHQSGYVALATVSIAQSSADQRKGRAGRTQAGNCLRLWSAGAKLEAMRPPEIARMELDDLVLFWAALEKGMETKTNWFEEPPKFALERAREKAQDAGLLDARGRLTEFGRKVQSLPVSLEWARVLLLSPEEFRGQLCDLCALATARRNPIRPTRSEEVAKLRKADWGEEPWTAALLLLLLGDEKKHALDGEALALCRKVADDLREATSAGPREAKKLPSLGELRQFLIKVWPERFFLLRSGRRAWGNGKVECRLARGEDPPEDCTACFLLQVNPILARGLKVELSGRWPLPVRVSELRKAGLGEPELSKIRWRGELLQARVVWKHAGRELGSEEEVLSGKALRRALTQMAAEGRWRPELWGEIEERIFYRNLAARLDGEPGAEVDLGQILEQRLADLGVEECEELALLEDEDFLPEAVDALRLEKLQKDYPFRYRIGGHSFKMEYEPRKKRVIMHSQSQSKGIKLKTQHLPRWNGWKVELDERGRRTILRS